MTPAEIQAEAATVADFMQTHGDFYDNPLWTLNAFAFTGEGAAHPFIAALPDKLIMGDGIIDAYDAIGLGDVGIRGTTGPRVRASCPVRDRRLRQRTDGPRRGHPPYRAHGRRHGRLLRHPQEGPGAQQEAGRRRAPEASTPSATASSTAPATTERRSSASAPPTGCAHLAAAAKPRSYILPPATFVELFDEALPHIISGT